MLVRKGRIVGSVAIAVSSAAGDFEIDSWMKGRETRASAAKVVSRSAKSWPWISATGATSAAVADSEETKLERPVFGSARFRITGVRTSTRGLSWPIAAFRSTPRPARALPNSSRLAWIAVRVGLSNMLKTWSISTGSGRAALSGIVEPALKPWLESPRLIWRYFRPSADLERTTIVESSGSCSRSLLRSMSTLATWPVHWRVGSNGQGASVTFSGVIAVIWPTRWPPMRTSLPLTMLLASGSCAESW